MAVSVSGCIVRKKKRRDFVVLTIRPIYPTEQQQQPSTNDSDAFLLPATNVRVHRERFQPVLTHCFVEARLRLEAVVVPQADQDATITDTLACAEATFVELLTCAPDPQAVQLAWEGIRQGILPHSVLPFPLLPEHHTDKSASASAAADQRPTCVQPPVGQPLNHLMLASMVRQLRDQQGEANDCAEAAQQGHLYATRRRRQRLPHTKRNDLKILHRMEQEGQSNDAAASASASNWTLLSVHQHQQHPQQEPTIHKTQLSLALNVPDTPPHQNDNLACRRTTRDLATRQDYLLRKKEPQINYFLQTLQRWNPSVVLDVGGGRGDLAVCAALALPDAHVCLVDNNDSSLEAAQRHATRQGCHHRMTFCRQDFANLLRGTQDLPPPLLFEAEEDDDNDKNHDKKIKKNMVVVALHACGDLSDLALAFAISHKAPFLICPCCFTKHAHRQANAENKPNDDDDQQQQQEETNLLPKTPEQQAPLFFPWQEPSTWPSLARLAELNERPDLSQRAQTVLNSMRLSHVRTHHAEDYDRVALEAYDTSYSKRNQLLVGERTG